MGAGAQNFFCSVKLLVLTLSHVRKTMPLAVHSSAGSWRPGLSLRVNTEAFKADRMA